MNYNSFFLYIVRELGLRIFKQHGLDYLFNNNFKNSSNITYNNKQLIFENDEFIFLDDKDKLLNIVFKPLTQYGNLCSLLAIEDAIHTKLSFFTRTIFKKVLDMKFNNYIQNIHYKFDKEYIAQLPDGDKNTINKWNNICNIINATSFSRNLINFSIDISNQQELCKVNIIYPLYEYLLNINNNVIFGVLLNDSEIELFKQIYKYFIIDKIDKLFVLPIAIPFDSSSASKFYSNMKMYSEIKELIKNEYNIIDGTFKRFNIDKEMNNLNQFTNKDFAHNNLSIQKQQEAIDKESYEKELQIRKECEPNWLILKDSIMQEKSTNQNIVVSTDNNKKIRELELLLQEKNKTYNQRIQTFINNENLNSFIQDYKLMQNNKEWSEIFYWQNLVLDILNGQGASFWFDTRINKYCFRSKTNGNLVEKNNDQISDVLTRALKESISSYLNNNSFFLSTHAIEIILVSKLNGIDKQKLKISEKADNVIKILIFENAIPTIDDDKFNIQSSIAFFKEDNALLYTRNRFISNKYLIKRFEHSSLPILPLIKHSDVFTLNKDSYLFENKEDSSVDKINFESSSFIEKFLFYLVKEDHGIYYYVMNWLATFFNTLQKSGTALVFQGDQEVTQDMFWNNIINEIFGLQHCVNINDEKCNSTSTFSIAKDKLFFHIGDITNPASEFDDITLYKIVKDLLVKSSISNVDENNEIEETLIHGQIIVTAKNPFPYIKRAMSKCTIIKVNDLDTIIDKLNVPDEIILEDNIQKDLENFTDILRSFPINLEFSKYAMDTEDRESTKKNKTHNIDKEDIDNKIDNFILAIKNRNKNLDYFAKVENIEDGKLYEQMKIAFDKDDGYFIGQDLLKYYNAIHEQKFSTQKQLMDKLKEKDEMFKQEVKTLKIQDKESKVNILFQAPKTSKEFTNKELYKITDYTMAKDITIPFGAIIISSQENITKYNHYDLENAIKIHKEYKLKKAQDKKEKEIN